VKSTVNAHDSSDNVCYGQHLIPSIGCTDIGWPNMVGFKIMASAALLYRPFDGLHREVGVPWCSIVRVQHCRAAETA